jgi:hypothetical protein
MNETWLLGIVIVGVVVLAVLARLAAKGNPSW